MKTPPKTLLSERAMESVHTASLYESESKWVSEWERKREREREMLTFLNVLLYNLHVNILWEHLYIFLVGLYKDVVQRSFLASKNALLGRKICAKVWTQQIQNTYIPGLVKNHGLKTPSPVGF